MGERTRETKPATAHTTSTTSTSISLTPRSGYIYSDSAKAWRVFQYEVEMFREGRAHIQDWPDSSWQKNAVVESYLLHIRNLCELFDVNKRRDPDDVLPTHLFTDWDTQRCARAKQRVTELLALYGSRSNPGHLRYALNKRLAHMTLQRGEAIGYDYSKMLVPLIPVLDGLIAMVVELKGGGL